MPVNNKNHLVQIESKNHHVGIIQGHRDFENSLFNDRRKWSYWESFGVSWTRTLWLLNFNMFSARKTEIYKEEKSQRTSGREVMWARRWVGRGEVWGPRPRVLPLRHVLGRQNCPQLPWASWVYAFEKWQKSPKVRVNYGGNEVSFQLSRSWRLD